MRSEEREAAEIEAGLDRAFHRGLIAGWLRDFTQGQTRYRRWLVTENTGAERSFGVSEAASYVRGLLAAEEAAE